MVLLFIEIDSIMSARLQKFRIFKISSDIESSDNLFIRFHCAEVFLESDQFTEMTEFKRYVVGDECFSSLTKFYELAILCEILCVIDICP